MLRRYFDWETYEAMFEKSPGMHLDGRPCESGASAPQSKTLRELAGETLQSRRLLCFIFPDHDGKPAEFAQRALMRFVACDVAFELLHPLGAAMRGRRAVFTAAMPMPEAAVDENGDFAFPKNDVGADEAKRALRWLRVESRRLL